VSVTASSQRSLGTLVSPAAHAALASARLQDDPCAHLVIDDFLKPEIAATALDEFERVVRWKRRRHHGQSKSVFTSLADMPALVQDIVRALHDDECRSRVQDICSVQGLRADPDMEGGGLCEMQSGDFMRPHLDSLGHVTRPRWRRRHALFLFLNRDWSEENGGHLILWDRETGKQVSIAPLYNRFVFFADPAGVFHGVNAVKCADGQARRSIAVYYYTEERDALPLRPTTYGRLGAENVSPGVSGLNQWLVWTYFALKRRFSRHR